MARGKGFQGIVGVKIGSTWGTEVVPASGDGIEVESLTVNGGLELIPDMQLTGAITAKPSSNGNHKVDVEINTAYRFEGLGPLLAMVMGTAGAPSAADTSGYKHVLKPKSDLDGIFGTIAYEYLKDALVGVLPSVKFHEFTISGKQGERIMLNVKGIADTFTDASASNTTTTIDSITVPSNREYATFSQTSFLLNNQSAGSLASAPIYVQGFEIKVSRPHKENVTTERGNKTSEPLPSGFAEVTGKFDFAAVANGTGGNALFLADQMAGTAKKVKVSITGSTLIGSSTQYTGLDIWLPYVQLLPGAKPTPSEPGSIAWSQDARMSHVGTIPTGFTSGYTDAITIDQYNLRATDNLA